jgi:hypothetical protein
MRILSSTAFTLGLLLVFCGAGAEKASAQSQKYGLDPLSVPNIMVDEGTPIIMQGLKRPQRATQGRRHTNKEAERPKKEAERRVNIPRGSASFVPPISSVTPLPRTPLVSSPPPAAAYNPPPVSNPSERITQFNQSFQFNKGLGNNPTNRDAYVRYNFNR